MISFRIFDLEMPDFKCPQFQTTTSKKDPEFNEIRFIAKLKYKCYFGPEIGTTDSVAYEPWDGKGPGTGRGEMNLKCRERGRDE